MRPVHEYTVDRATMTAKVGSVNPIRKYIDGAPDENPPVIVQLCGSDLRFYDQGGQPLSIEEVPESILDHLRKNPLRKGHETIEQVLRFCEFCPRTVTGDFQPIASGEWEEHLKEHIRAAAISSRKLADDSNAASSNSAQRRNKE